MMPLPWPNWTEEEWRAKAEALRRKRAKAPPHIAKALHALVQGDNTVALFKTEEEQRLVTGWASVIDDEHGQPLVDSQGDVIDEQELVEAAHEFIRSHRRAGDAHARLDGIGTVVESLVLTKAMKDLLGLPASVPRGWLITVHVEDDDVWAKVKSGEYSSFSIGGSAVRETF